MTISAQFLYQVGQPATPTMEAVGHGLPPVVARPLSTPHTWQTVVLLGELNGSPAWRQDGVTYVRFDAPQRSLPDPWMLAQWSADIGWHRSLADLNSASPSLAARSAEATRVGATIELQWPHLAPRHVPAAPSIPSSPIGHTHLRQLLAEAAHDIRSPIVVAQQILATLSRRVQAGGNLAEDEGDLLDQAKLRLAQANQWAEGILLERSLEHGQPVNVRRRFYPHQWQLGIEPLLRSLALQSGVQLEWCGWDRSLPRLYLDPIHLSRVVLNLVTNALQASQPASRVRVSVAWLTNITQQLVITIEDEGSGLPAQLLHNINSPEPWPALTGADCGVGLGLKTAKSLARSLGGMLTAQISHRGGTQFSLCLPVDNYHSLIRSWLRRNAEHALPQRRAVRQQISIHAVRCLPPARGQLDPIRHGIDLTGHWDRQFQRAARESDLVYRVAKDRWLWLSLADEASTPLGKSAQPIHSSTSLPSALAEVLEPELRLGQGRRETGACRQQQVFRLDNLSYHDWLDASSSQHNLLSITSALAEKFAELIGDHVPPIDDLQSQSDSNSLWSENRSRVRPLRRDQAQGIPAPRSLHNSSPTQSLADTPCEAFSGTLAELSQQWHARQCQLDHAHMAFTRSVGHPY